MSRKANCWDNAPMESFFGTLKTELVHHREYSDRDTARRDLFAFIEGYYNRRRIHSAIGYITPQQAEAKYANPVSTFPGEGHLLVRSVAGARGPLFYADKQSCLPAYCPGKSGKLGRR
jgi:hypothetical protein